MTPFLHVGGAQGRYCVVFDPRQSGRQNAHEKVCEAGANRPTWPTRAMSSWFVKRVFQAVCADSAHRVYAGAGGGGINTPSAVRKSPE